MRINCPPPIRNASASSATSTAGRLRVGLLQKIIDPERAVFSKSRLPLPEEKLVTEIAPAEVSDETDPVLHGALISYQACRGSYGCFRRGGQVFAAFGS